MTDNNTSSELQSNAVPNVYEVTVRPYRNFEQVLSVIPRVAKEIGELEQLLQSVPVIQPIAREPDTSEGSLMTEAATRMAEELEQVLQTPIQVLPCRKFARDSHLHEYFQWDKSTGDKSSIRPMIVIAPLYAVLQQCPECKRGFDNYLFDNKNLYNLKSFPLRT